MEAESAWNLYESTHPSIIDKLFSGKYDSICTIIIHFFTNEFNNKIGMQKTIVTCVKCNRTSVTYNPFMTLSLTCETSLDKCI